MISLLVLRFFDAYFLSLVCRLLKVTPGSKLPRKVRRIVVLKLWAIGDSILLLPALKELKRSVPHCEIHVLVHRKNSTLFEGQPFIDSVVPLSFRLLFRPNHYDIAMDAEPWLNVSAILARRLASYAVGFSHGVRSSLYSRCVALKLNEHMVNNYHSLLSVVSCSSSKPLTLVPLKIKAEEHHTIYGVLADFRGDRDRSLFAIAPGVGPSLKIRQWPAENFARLADQISLKWKADILFLGGKNNIRDVTKVRYLMTQKSFDLSGKLTPKEVAATLELCEAFVANDSGLMHLATAMGTPTLALFGPTSTKLWRPFGLQHVSLSSPVPDGHFADNRKHWPMTRIQTHRNQSVMSKISVNQAFDGFCQLIDLNPRLKRRVGSKIEPHGLTMTTL